MGQILSKHHHKLRSHLFPLYQMVKSRLRKKHRIFNQVYPNPSRKIRIRWRSLLYSKEIIIQNQYRLLAPPPLRTVSKDELSSNEESVGNENKCLNRIDEKKVHKNVEEKNNERDMVEVQIVGTTGVDKDKNVFQNNPEKTLKISGSEIITCSKENLKPVLTNLNQETVPDKSSRVIESDENSSSSSCSRSVIGNSSSEENTTATSQSGGSVLQNGTLEAASALMTLIRRSHS